MCTLKCFIRQTATANNGKQDSTALFPQYPSDIWSLLFISTHVPYIHQEEIRKSTHETTQLQAAPTIVTLACDANRAQCNCNTFAYSTMYVHCTYFMLGTHRVTCMSEGLSQRVQFTWAWKTLPETINPSHTRNKTNTSLPLRSLWRLQCEYLMMLFVVQGSEALFTCSILYPKRIAH